MIDYEVFMGIPSIVVPVSEIRVDDVIVVTAGSSCGNRIYGHTYYSVTDTTLTDRDGVVTGDPMKDRYMQHREIRKNADGKWVYYGKKVYTFQVIYLDRDWEAERASRINKSSTSGQCLYKLATDKNGNITKTIYRGIAASVNSKKTKKAKKAE